MRRIFVIMMIAVATLAACGNRGTGTVTTQAVVEEEQVVEKHVTDDIWLQLFLGMESDTTDWHYLCQAPELDDVPGLLKQELEATWYHDDEDYPSQFKCSLGLYMDQDYPSSEVFDQVEMEIDKLLTDGFSHYDELDEVSATLKTRSGYAPRDARDVLDRAKSVFDGFTSRMQATKQESAYDQYPETRVCIVSHKIYDKGDWASYIIEFSFSYNGSNGCPSWAEYITVNKKTGKRISADDLVKKYGEQSVAAKLREAYVSAKQAKEFDLDVYNYTGEALIKLADDCAIVNEGVMFYYRPYSVGCGAEGDYHLMLDCDWD